MPAAPRKATPRKAAAPRKATPLSTPPSKATPPSDTFPSAIILAAGESSRFWPLATGRHKSLFELGGVSLLERTVRSVAEIGVREIVIVQSPRTAANVLPSDVLPARLGRATLQFVEQPVPAGQGNAIQLCADLVGDSFFVIQPENINAGDICLELLSGPWSDDIAVVPGQRRADFPLYAVLDHTDGRLTRIVEKPKRSKESKPLCNMGMYLFKRDFFSVLARVKPGPLSIIAAIGSAGRAGRAGVVTSKNQFLPLKVPGHLWAYVRWLGLEPWSEGAPEPTASRRILGPGAVLGDDLLDNAIVGSGSVVGAGTRTVGLGAWDDLDAVLIGPGAVIGSDVRLHPRTRIGAGATIGRGAEVRGDVPDGATVEANAVVPA